MPEIFAPYIHRGEHNAILLENAGLVIFKQISQLKEQGHNLPGIISEFRKSDLPGANKPVVKQGETGAKQDRENIIYELYNKIDQERKRLFEEKDARLQAIADLNALKIGLRLLTDGKTDDVEKARSEMNRRRLKRAELLGKLETLSFWQTSKRKKLLNELKSLDHSETPVQTDQVDVQTG